MVEALFWPALLAYGEAALAYSSPRTTRAATWGVRIGWLAQTATHRLKLEAGRRAIAHWEREHGALSPAERAAGVATARQLLRRRRPARAARRSA